MRTRALVTAGLVAAATAAYTGVAAADTSYDLYTVASGYGTAPTSTPTGAFTYAKVPAASYASPTAYLPVTTEGNSDTGLPGFVGSDSGNFPYFAVNRSTTAYSSGSQTVPPTSFVSHPGPNQDGVVVFTVPGGGAGTVSASVTLRSDDPGGGGDSTSGALFAADSSGAVIGGSTALVPRPRAGSVALTLPSTSIPAGGHVYLVLDKNATYNADSTGIDMSVTVGAAATPALPEAGLALALPLVGLAAAGTAAVRRRRRRA